MAETIGLTAIFDISDFNRGKEQYLSGLTVMDKSTNSAASVLTGQFVGLGQGVLKFGAIAGGVALAGVTALAGGLVYLGTQALESYAKYERMSLSIQNLVARELSQGKESITQKQVLAQLTAKEAAEIDSLNLKIQEEGLERQSQLAKIQEQKQRIWELTQAYGENGLNVQTAKAKLAEMEFELTKSDAATSKYTARINELNAKNGQLVTVTEKVRTGQMSMTEAMTQAGPKAKELLDWISKLAIQSPFTQDGIALAFKTAMTYGFTTEEAIKLTEAEVDFAAATGSSIDSANQIALALGQMQAKGKVSGQELIQLTNAGIGTNAILEKMGFTVDDVSKGLVSSDKFIEAVITDMEVFKGAAAGQANTFSGLLSSLEELKDVGLRELFTGTFQAIQPYLATFVGTLTDPATFDALRTYGTLLGGTIVSGLKEISRLILAFQMGGSVGLIYALGLTPQTTAAIEKVTGSISFLYNEAKRLMLAFQMGGTTGLIYALGLTPQTTQIIMQVISVISSIGTTLANLLNPVNLINNYFNEMMGALIGIGAVLGSSAIAAILAGIATAIGALLSPIGLLIAGVALLGAAWAGNWGNIQGVFAQFVAFWQEQWPLITAVALTAWQVLQSVWAGIVAAITPAFQSIQQAFNNLTVAMASVGISWGDVGNALLTAVGYVMAGIGVAIVAVISIITSFVTAWASAIQTTSTWIMTLKTNVESVFAGIVQTFSGAFTLIQGILSLNGTQILSGWNLMTQGMINTLLGTVQTIGNLFIAMGATVNSFMTSFVSSMIAFWQNLYMTLVGGSIVPDMATAIINVFTMMVSSITTLLSTATQPIVDIFNTISNTVQTLMANLFSGVGTVSLDLTTLTTTLPQAILTNINLISQMLSLLTSINTMIVITLPVSLKTFRDIAIQVFDEIITKLTEIVSKFSVMQSAIMGVQSALQTMSTNAVTSLGALNSALQTTTGKFQGLANAANDAKSASSGLADTASKYGKLEDAINKITEAFKKMAEAARQAGAASSGAVASGGASAGVGFERGVGFAEGTLGLGYKIPSGYPNDTFGPMYAQSGEEMLITPKGTSIEDLIFRRLSGLNMSQPKQQPTINVYTGDINNGMDLSMLENFITTTVANSFA